MNKTYIKIYTYTYKLDKTPIFYKTPIIYLFLLRKRAITTFLSQKFMITRLLIAFEDLLGSSIAPQVMPH